MFRDQEMLTKTLAKIQAQVIGYGLACKIFQLFENNREVISDWRGELQNCTYKYGGRLLNQKL